MKQRPLPQSPTPKISPTLESARAALEEQIAFARKSLAEECEIFSQTLHQKALALQNVQGWPAHLFNGLGEIQGQGPIIDAKFAHLVALANVLRDISNEP